MNNYRKWTYKFLIYLPILFIMLMFINYSIDPFNIFDSKVLNRDFQPNGRYLKIEHLTKNKNKYNSLIIGSSRIGNTDPAIIEKYLPGSKFYNFTLGLSNLNDNLIHLNYLIENNYKIKNIYLQVDVLENFDSFKLSEGDFHKKYHPLVSKENPIAFYFKYLTIFPFKNLKGKLEKNLIGEDKWYFSYDIKKTGRLYINYNKELFKANPEYFFEVDESLQRNEATRHIKGQYIKQNLKALKEIKLLCDTNNINLIVFITPHNYNMINKFDLKDYITFIEGIADITNFWDFSGYNTITTNNINYYEASHYKPFIADMIAARIFNDNNSSIPPDFGVYVNKKNLKQHIVNIKSQFKEADNLYPVK